MSGRNTKSNPKLWMPKNADQSPEPASANSSNANSAPSNSNNASNPQNANTSKGNNNRRNQGKRNNNNNKKPNSNNAGGAGGGSNAPKLQVKIMNNNAAAAVSKEELERKKEQEEKEKQRKLEEEERQKEIERQKKEEEERKKREQEREEEEKRKKQELEQRKISIEESIVKLKEIKSFRIEKRKLRELNLKVGTTKRPEITAKADIKKSTTFTKKIKQTISDDNVDLLCKEINQLNLNRYVSEVVAGITESKLRNNDITAAIKVCSLMHQKYDEFSGLLIPKLLKLFEPANNANASETEQEKKDKFMKKRVTLKLITELYLAALFNDEAFLIGIINDVTMNSKKTKDEEVYYMDLLLILNFVRGVTEELFGIEQELPAVIVNLLTEHQTFNESQLKSQQIPKSDESIQTIENNNNENNISNNENESNVAKNNNNNDNEKLEKPFGEEYLSAINEVLEPLEPIVPIDVQKKFKDAIMNYYKVICHHLLSDHKKLQDTEREKSQILETKGVLPDGYADQYSKQLKSYEKLLASVTTLSEILKEPLPDLPKDETITRITTEVISSSQKSKSKPEEESIFGDEETRSFYEDLPDLKSLLPVNVFGEKEKEPEKDPGSSEDNNKLPENEKSDPSKSVVDSSQVVPPSPSSSAVDAKKEKKSSILDSLLQRLPHCVNRELIDKIAEEFCLISSKYSRKKLVSAMYNVPRTELVLIPYYARLAATLSQYYPDIGADLLGMLEQEFLTKDQPSMIESKIRNIRFLSELTKFRICPYNIIFNCLQICLDSFAPHHITVSTTLLETCGRFLYRNPETHVRTNNMLTTLLRLKNVKVVDDRFAAMIENAYYHCKPPERKIVKKVYTLPQQYIRKLIFEDLSKENLKFIIKQLEKLDWSVHEDFLVKCLLTLSKIKYSSLNLLAQVVGSIKNDAISIKVVDNLLYQIFHDLEDSSATTHQKRVMDIKFLGELYNYCVIENNVIFDTLYTILYNEAQEPTDTFNIRLVCTLLATTGQYFDTKSCKPKLDRFMIHFQYYYWSKNFIPVDVEYMVLDTLELVVPKLKRYTSLDQARNVYQALLKEEERKNSKFNIHRNVITLNVGKLENTATNDDEEEEKRDNTDTVDNDDADSTSSVSESNSSDKEIVAPENDNDYVRRKPTPKKSNEEEEFDKMFQAMVQESMDSRKVDRHNASSIPQSLLNFSRSKITPTEKPSEGAANITVLLRKNNKQIACNVEIPVESPLVVSSNEKLAEEKEENEDIKRYVMRYASEEERSRNAPQGRANQKNTKKVYNIPIYRNSPPRL